MNKQASAAPSTSELVTSKLLHACAGIDAIYFASSGALDAPIIMARAIPICVFAKPPQPGLVKTRLAQRLGATVAADFARAFLEDTWFGLQVLSWARPIIALAEGDPPSTLAAAEIWPQGDGDLGQRLARVLGHALELAPYALAIGADTPGLPHPLIGQAVAALHDHDAVIGPADDGGFYVLGLRRCPAALLEGLPWSAPDTCAATRQRLLARGLRVATLAPWFDVDDADDLARLLAMHDAGTVHAPRTRAIALTTSGLCLDADVRHEP